MRLVSIEKGKLGQTCAQKNVVWRWRQMGWCICKLNNTKDYLQSTRNRDRGKEQILLHNPQKATALPAPWSWISSFHNCETVNFCCLSWCYLVTAGLGNKLKKKKSQVINGTYHLFLDGVCIHSGLLRNRCQEGIKCARCFSRSACLKEKKVGDR